MNLVNPVAPGGPAIAGTNPEGGTVPLFPVIRDDGSKVVDMLVIGGWTSG